MQEAQPSSVQPPPAFDPLAAFANWFVSQPGFGVPQSPFDAVSKVGPFTGLILYRKKPYQVQLWICDPNSEIPDHRHPNVDSIQCYVSGEMSLRLNGKDVMPLASVKPNADGYSTARGSFLRVTPADTHGATIGPSGASFMTFQHWLSGEPRSVEIDWEGDPINEDHAIAIKKK